ncbi:MAG TPA: hypothetical protein VHO68_11195, partial [Bacteroidales bacterium]|nr:hypothetical protein [Bacteroidales bacterium]
MKKRAFILLILFSFFSFSLAAQCIVNAGIDETICQGGTTAGLGGSIGDGTTALWTSSSGGTFTPDASTLNAKWTPLPGYTGTTILTLTGSGGSCGPTSDTKDVIVNAPLP